MYIVASYTTYKKGSSVYVSGELRQLGNNTGITELPHTCTCPCKRQKVEKKDFASKFDNLDKNLVYK